MFSDSPQKYPLRGRMPLQKSDAFAEEGIEEVICWPSKTPGKEASESKSKR